MKKKYKLDSNWFLKQIDSNNSLETNRIPFFVKADWDNLIKIKKMPAQVHEILIDEGIIENPNIRGNSDHCLWVGKSDWLYITDFSFEPSDGISKITIGGLDTFASVYLNGELIGTHEDVYIPLIADISGKLKKENQLIIHFKSPERVLDEIEIAPELENMIPRSARARVFHSSYIDYLGPKPYLPRVGIYGDVFIELIDECEIGFQDVRSNVDEDLMSAKVTVNVEVSGDFKGLDLGMRLVDPDGNLVAEGVQRLDKEPCAFFEFDVEEPELWWPRLHGEQPLYTLETQLKRDMDIKDTMGKRIGLRRLEMVGDFDFRINNHPIKLWGVNIAPLDTLTNCYNKEKTELMLKLADNAYIECFRIWGENERLSDDFYDLCDEKGYLLWHDFFCGNTMYPTDYKLFDLIRQEAEFQVKRLKHRPSILLWCGGNEGIMGKDYNFPGENYSGIQILEEIFPSVCEKYDPDRYYHRTSPDGGAYSNDPLAGDTHGYTHLWYVPGNLHPIFLSENCRVSTPALRTMKRMMAPEDLWPDGYTGQVEKNSEMTWPKTWNKYNSNEGYIKLGEVESFYDPTDLEGMLYRIGWGHGIYIKGRVERYRRGRPLEMKDINERITKGHLLWKFNNSCNHIFFGIVDYFMEPYIAYYSLRRAYKPVLLSFDMGNFINLWMVNDSMEKLEGTVHVQLFNPLENRVEKSFEHGFEIHPDESKVITDLNQFGQFRKYNILYAYATTNQGEKIAEAIDYVDIERHIRFPEDAKISITVNGGDLYLKADKFARSVELLGNNNGDEFGWMFEDNYFDLIPGQIKKVRVLGKHSEGIITAKGYYSNISTDINYSRP